MSTKMANSIVPQPTPSDNYKTNMFISQNQKLNLQTNNKRSVFLMPESPEKLQKTQSISVTDRDVKDVLSTENSPCKVILNEPTQDTEPNNLTPVKRTPYTQVFQIFPSRDLLQQKQKSLSSIEETLPVATDNTHKNKKIDQASVKIQEEKECKFCQEADVMKNFIRPCLCRGSMQHVHQKCVQKDIEENYMDQERRSFTKSLKCQICKFEYVIKTYKHYDLREALKDNEKKSKLQLLFLGFIGLLITIIGLSAALGIQNEELTKKIDMLVMVVVICFVCVSLLIMIIYHIGDLAIQFSWKVLDRNQKRIEDQGMIVNMQALNMILQNTRQRLSSSIVPLPLTN